jgi:trehalose 6-phosphate phosphatase
MPASVVVAGRAGIGGYRSRTVAADPLAPFLGDPEGSGLLFDVDGTLAPIAARPGLARVHDATLELLRALVARYRLVGVVSGRSLADVRAMVPVDGLLAAGNHGLELDTGDGPRLAAGVAHAQSAVDAAAARIEPALGGGAWLERKGPTLTIHYREARDPAAAAEEAYEAASPVAHELGLDLRAARMALELRPPIGLDKGTAARALLAARPCRRSLYCGDDVTDLDAFRVVDLAVAVVSDEAPPGLVAAADLAVHDVPELLERLARGAA